MANVTTAFAPGKVPNSCQGFDRMYLNGTGRRGRNDQALENRDPYSNELLVCINLASEQDLNGAFRAAASHFRWSSVAIAQDELFGPAVAVIKVKGEEEVVLDHKNFKISHQS